MAFRFSLFAILASAIQISATPQHLRRTNTVAINNLTQNTTTIGGQGSVSAAGNLSPFGDIGVGCGINWQEDKSYGGGLQAGSNDYGLGGGFTIAPESISIGLGIGINTANTSASVQFTGNKTGEFEFVFESSTGLVCTPGVQDGKSTVTCKSA